MDGFQLRVLEAELLEVAVPQNMEEVLLYREYRIVAEIYPSQAGKNGLAIISCIDT